ncbi:MAG: DUF4358 domain-containing protein [Ruminococcaceae bacterium]|nr:DUF4358 domain-containing protein [Oscillospiraceae bacterium]
MKKITILLLLLTLIFTFNLVSCNKEENSENTAIEVSDYAFETVVESLLNEDVLSNVISYTKDGENVLDADYFEYYFSDPALLEGISEYFYCTSATTSVSEVGIFQVKDSDTKESLLKAFDTRQSTLVSTYESYSPEDVQIAENMKKGSFDDIVWFVATTDNDTLSEIIKK